MTTTHGYISIPIASLPATVTAKGDIGLFIRPWWRRWLYRLRFGWGKTTFHVKDVSGDTFSVRPHPGGPPLDLRTE